MMRPLDVRQVRTRAALRSAMLELAQEMPFAELSVGDIAARAQVGPATFYRHYRDKSALLADVADDLTAALALKITPLILAADSRAAALSLCQFIDERREVCTALLAGGAKSVVIDQILEQATSQAEESGIAANIWLPPSLGTLFMVTSILTLVGWWLHRGENTTVDEMSILLDRLVLSPVLNAP